MKTKLARRDFLKAAMLTPLAVAWPAWMPRLAFTPPQTTSQGDILVVIFLRGAADVLNMIVPHGEEAYYQARPTLRIPRPDDNAANRAVDLDGFFGFHPDLKPLLPAWQAGHLGVIHACGAPDESRSHFKAMELMERGVEDEHGPASGWIGRHLASHNTGNPSPLRAIGLGESVPQSLYGSVPATALRSIIDFHLGGDPRAAQQMHAALGALYQGQDELSIIGQETLKILDTVTKLDPNDYAAETDLAYPQNDFGRSLQQVAMLVKAQVGLEVAAVDLGGWDTHFAQGGTEGLMAELLKDFAAGLAAFYQDMHAHLNNLTVVVMSEFGRRVKENASLGTDHGHGSLMFLMGGNVVGSRVHGDWPGLSPGSLFGPGDLAVTTDYRDVLSEVLHKRLNNPAVDTIFPEYETSFHGFVNSSNSS